MKTVTIMTARELADTLRISDHTLRRLRSEGIIRSYRIRVQVRFILEEVLEDLRRAESELPLRRIRGTLVRSGGPAARFKGSDPPLSPHTTVLDPMVGVWDADEKEAYESYEEEKRRRINQSAFDGEQVRRERSVTNRKANAEKASN